VKHPPSVLRSAGLLMFKRAEDGLRLLLAHPGGPFWAKKDLGAWSIQKGEYRSDETPLAAAIREFIEEMGATPAGDFLPLGELVQPSRKTVTAFALEGDFDTGRHVSNVFELEWPPRSGRRQAFPEVDRAEWFDVPSARRKILPGQAPFIDRLLARIGEQAA
jgi:predicted NUDIX family NTP pyrophosphohydrolase